jgi:hypothetical protein
MLNRCNLLNLIFPASAVFFSCIATAKAGLGIFDDFAEVNGVTYEGQYDLTGNPKMSGGVSLGTVSSLIFNGGEVKTYKNGSDNVTGADIWYRVWATSGGPSGSFSATVLNFGFNITGGNPGDQDWNNYNANINVLSGLTSGNYTLDMYYEIYGTGSPTDNNRGSDYLFTFSVVPEPITLALPIFGGLVATAGLARRFIPRWSNQVG